MWVCWIRSNQPLGEGNVCLLSIIWPTHGPPYCVAVEISSSLSPSCITGAWRRPPPLPRRVRVGREALGGGGPCELEDDEGKGATVALTLPAAPGWRLWGWKEKQATPETIQNQPHRMCQLWKDTTEEEREAVREVEKEITDKRQSKCAKSRILNTTAEFQCRCKWLYSGAEQNKIEHKQSLCFCAVVNDLHVISSINPGEWPCKQRKLSVQGGRCGTTYRKLTRGRWTMGSSSGFALRQTSICQFLWCNRR